MKAYEEEMLIVDRARLADLPRVVDLWMELMRLTERFNKRYALAPGARRLQESYMRSFFDSSSAAIFVAREGERAGAFANVYITKPAPVFAQHVLGIIENIYVEPDFRGRGLGRQLVEASHRFFRTFRVDEVYVNVIPANENSRKFWEHMGYSTQKLTMAFTGQRV
ncbi:GNAT family N-acetyltransferase [bacterium]|nr:GNAT family N-acetyltransferase [bacterium]